MPTTTEPCPVPRCPRRHSRDYLMCRPCWSRVPAELRAAVRERNLDRMRETIATLRAVQADAIDAATPPEHRQETT